MKTSEREGGVGAAEGAAEPGSSLLWGSTFVASGGGSNGGACTVGVVERRLERARQGDAVRNGAGLARGGRRPRLGVIR